jgi:hypothetical protein
MEPSSSSALGLTSPLLITTSRPAATGLAWRSRGMLASPRSGAMRGEMTMRQMQSVDRSDRLTAILILINAVALVLLAFVL